MERQDVEIIEVELKYCERCGGLWIRPKGSQRVFCAACAPTMEEIEVPLSRLRLEMPVGDGESFEPSLEELAFLCSEGGNA